MSYKTLVIVRNVMGVLCLGILFLGFIFRSDGLGGLGLIPILWVTFILFVIFTAIAESVAIRSGIIKPDPLKRKKLVLFIFVIVVLAFLKQEMGG